MATITITVTVAGGKFVLNGISQYTYPATPGNTYKFDQAEGTNDGHPLRLATAADAAGGTEYTTGVTTSGTPGNAGAYTQIEVTATTIQALHYYCSNHGGMGGLFNVGSSETVQYQDRAGFSVQNRTENPIPFAQALINNPYSGSWASGGSLNDGRSSFTGIGIQTATVAVSGQDSTTSLIDSVEEYNGTAWTEVNDTPVTLKYPGAGGVLTAGWVAGGLSTYNGTAFSAETFEYDGTNWTDSGNINTTRYVCYGGGPQTAAFIAGGNNTSFAAVDDTELYNGSAWTEVADLNTARANAYGNGTQTAGIYAGGSPGTKTDAETWDGSSWTEVSELNTGRYSIGVGGGTSPGSSSLAVGGTDGSNNKANVESWNGSAWTETSDLAATNSSNGLGISSNQSAISFGGFSPTPSTFAVTSEEWTFTGVQPTDAASYSGAITGDIYYNTSDGQFKAIKDGGAPIGTWASGGNLPQNMILQGAFGGRDSVTTGGGSKSDGVVGDSFQYNGVAWSEIAELNTLRNQSAGLGTQGSGLVAGGYNDPPGQVVGNTENWNGSSWTEVADVSPVRTGAGSAGVYTAGLVFGGNAPPLTASTMTWNASAWTEVADLNSARNRMMGQAIGTQTAALAVEGEGVNGTESWNGSAWTEVADLNTARHLGGGSGLSTSAIVSSGRTGAPGYNPNAACESWDGSSWTEVADVSSARAYLSSAGTAGGNNNTESVIFGGATTSSTANTTATEEWNTEDFQTKTVTTS